MTNQNEKTDTPPDEPVSIDESVRDTVKNAQLDYAKQILRDWQRDRRARGKSRR